MERNTNEPLSLRLVPRCGAKRRNGEPCQRPAARGRHRCRLHGGAPGSGAPRGERNGNYKTGRHSQEALRERRMISDVIRRSR
jgi:hypothetical protein